MSFDDDTWELYHVAEDRSECRDLAAEMPEKVAELVELWWQEAEAHGVLPLDDRTIELFGTRFEPHSPHPPSRRYTYRPPVSPMPAQAGAAIGGRSWDLDAQVDRPEGAEGVIYATGSQTSGLTLFVQGDRLVFDYNCFGDHHVAESTATVPVGRSSLGLRFRRGGGGTGHADVVIDGEVCGGVDIPFVMSIVSSLGPSVGYDHGSPVSDRYHDEFAFQGALEQVDITLVSARQAEAAAAEADARASMSRQ